MGGAYVGPTNWLCNDCGHQTSSTLTYCTHCGRAQVSYAPFTMAEHVDLTFTLSHPNVWWPYTEGAAG
jgi:predicted amidophosphoribosyltransferase